MSALALLSPVAVMVYAATMPHASTLFVLGVGVSNLAYVLLIAGIIPPGTFRALRLYQRREVFIAGAAAWILGAILYHFAGQSL